MDTAKSKLSWVISGGFAGFVLVATVIGISLWNAQKNNQIVPPIPGLPAAPVVKDLPDLIANLSRSRSLCEGRAQFAIELCRKDRKKLKELPHGQKLYDDTRSELNGCIDYIRAALSRRFIDKDSARIASRLDDSNIKMREFTDWVDEVETGISVSRRTSYVETAASYIKEMLDRTNQQNEQAIVQLRSDLDSCRMREWRDLSR